jgi:hypothetical protein
MQPPAAGVIGAEASQAARQEHRRQDRLRVAMGGGWPEFPRSALTPRAFGIIEHVDGTLYKQVHGEITAHPTSPVVAFFIDPTGQAIFLEAVAGATRDELAQRRAQREARRATSKGVA